MTSNAGMPRPRGSTLLKCTRMTQAQRRTQVVEAVLAGNPYRTIAAELRVGLATIVKDVNAVLTEWQTTRLDLADSWITLENARLDQLLQGVYTKAIQGDLQAIDRVLKIMERRAKLLGLDAPQKIAPTDPSGQQPYEGMSDEARLARVMDLLALAEARRHAAEDAEQALPAARLGERTEEHT